METDASGLSKFYGNVMDFTKLNRFPKLSRGELKNFWGTLGVNRAISLVEQALDGSGEIDFSKSDTVALKMVNGSSDTARLRIINQGNSATPVKRTIIIPNLPKVYFIESSDNVTITVKLANGSDVVTFIPAVGITLSNLRYFLVVTDGKTIFRKSDGVFNEVVLWDNSGGVYVPSPADHGKIIVPTKPVLTNGQRPIYAFNDVARFPDGFRMTITCPPHFGPLTNRLSLNQYPIGMTTGALPFIYPVRGVTIVASRALNKWLIMSEGD